MIRLPPGRRIPPLSGIASLDSDWPSARCKAHNPSSPESAASFSAKPETDGHISDNITEYPLPCIMSDLQYVVQNLSLEKFIRDGI
jgi:hypothetical protein